MEVPLAKRIKVDVKMKEELTDHQQLNIMITVAAGRAGKLTGMATTQYMRTWHT